VNTRTIAFLVAFLGTPVPRAIAQTSEPNSDAGPEQQLAAQSAPEAPASAPPSPVSDPNPPAPPASPQKVSAPSEPGASLASIKEPEADEHPRPKPQPSHSRAHYHDGFYARISVGAGHVSSTLESGAANFELSGPAVALDFMLGGTPVPGFVIGAAYLFTQAPSPEVSSGVNSATLDYAFNVGVLGVFTDVFPDPGEGLHLGGVAGLASASLTSESGELASTARGFGGGGFLGYDGWVGKQWALGVLGRFMAASVSSSTDGVEETLAPWSLALVVSALNH